MRFHFIYKKLFAYETFPLTLTEFDFIVSVKTSYIEKELKKKIVLPWPHVNGSLSSCSAFNVVVAAFA